MDDHHFLHANGHLSLINPLFWTNSMARSGQDCYINHHSLNDSHHQQGAKGRCCAVAALQRALQGLQDVPPYGLREVLAWSPRMRLIKNGVVSCCLFQRQRWQQTLTPNGAKALYLSLSPKGNHCLAFGCSDVGDSEGVCALLEA